MIRGAFGMQVMKHNQRIVSEPSQLSTQGRNVPVSCGTPLGYCPGRNNIHPMITWSIPVLDILFENPPSRSSLNHSLTAETLQLLFVLPDFSLSFCFISPTLSILSFRGLFWAQNCYFHIMHHSWPAPCAFPPPKSSSAFPQKH